MLFLCTEHKVMDTNTDNSESSSMGLLLFWSGVVDM